MSGGFPQQGGILGAILQGEEADVIEVRFRVRRAEGQGLAEAEVGRPGQPLPLFGGFRQIFRGRGKVGQGAEAPGIKAGDAFAQFGERPVA